MKPRVDKFEHYDLVVYAARNSNGARRLATALGSRRWRDDLPERYSRRRPYFRGNVRPMVVNWGSTKHPGWLDDPRFRLEPYFVNTANCIKKAIDKLAFFQHASRINGVPLLKWTDSRDTAISWLGKGKHVICRTRLDGSSGQGIVLAKSQDELVEAPLYTRYYPKTHEFRVHIFNGEVIDFTQKKLRGGPQNELGRSLVRSLDNGWVHAHSNVQLNEGPDRTSIYSASSACVAGLGLLFGAVDVMAILDAPSNEETGGRSLKSFVICEVNTGPGLENQVTIKAYKNAVLKLHLSNKNKEKETNVVNLEGISGNQPESSVLL